MVNVKIDLTGHIYGRLTVLKQTEDYVSLDGRHHCCWLCQCSCENKTILPIRGTQLRSGKTQSCGCLQKERIKESNKKNKKKYNKYNLSGNYGIGYTFDNREFYFDLEDYNKIKNYSWSINPQGYVWGKRLDGSDRNVMMHRIIMGVTDIPHKEIMVDHKHGRNTRNDNRKSNLRLASNSQNCINIPIKSNNTSGYTGVI